MTTLFQIHANMTNLKSLLQEMATLWHAGDSVLLLGETAAYLDWFHAYVDDINANDEIEAEIREIDGLFVLSDDIQVLNDSAKINLNLGQVKQLTDNDWIALTDKVDRVITLTRTV